MKVPKKDVPKKDGENAEKARELIDKQSKMIEEEVEKIKTSTKGKLARFTRLQRVERSSAKSNSCDQRSRNAVLYDSWRECHVRACVFSIFKALMILNGYL